MVSKLRQWRLDRGWTLQEVADLVDLSVSELSLLERGKRRASAKMRIEFSRALGARVGSLFDPDTAPRKKGKSA